MKKLLLTIFSIVAVFTFLLAGSPDLSAESFENSTRFRYTIISQEKLTVEVAVSQYYKKDNIINLNIPSDVEYNGVTYSVVRIAAHGFSGLNFLASVNIPEGVEGIDREAFSNCPRLTEVNIPGTVETINGMAFANCTKLTDVNIENGVKSIKYEAFENCQALTSFYFPASLKLDGEDVFAQDYNLTDIQVDVDNPYYCAFDGILYNKDMTMGICFPSGTGDVVIPEGMPKLSADFLYWKRVTSITVPASLVSLPTYTLATNSIKTYVDSENPVFSSLDGMLLDKEGTTLYVYPFRTENLEIPDFVRVVSTYFYSGTQTATVPASVTKFTTSAFSGCEHLKTIYCYPTVPPEIDPQYFFPYDYYYYPGIDIFVPEESLELYKESPWNSQNVYPFGYVLPGTTFEVGDFTYKVLDGEGRNVEVISYLHNDFRAPDTIYVPKTVQYENTVFTITTLAEKLFENNPMVRTVVFPDNITVLPWRILYNCRGLRSITIPLSVKTIAPEAFYNCGLKWLDIPPGVSSIYAGAFASTDIELYVSESNPYFCSVDGALYTNDKETLLAWPAASKNVVLPVDIKKIGDCAFYENVKILSVNIPFSVERISEDAFFGCLNLKKIYCYPLEPPMIVYDGKHAFNNFAIDVYVPAEALENYQKDPEWSRFNLHPMDPSTIDCLVVNMNSAESLVFEMNLLSRIDFVDRGLEFITEVETTVPFKDISSITFDNYESLGVGDISVEDYPSCQFSLIDNTLRISCCEDYPDIHIYSIAGLDTIFITHYNGEYIDISLLAPSIYLVTAGSQNFKFIKR